jgi:hypothetical protein
MALTLQYALQSVHWCHVVMVPPLTQEQAGHQSQPSPLQVSHSCVHASMLPLSPPPC